MTKELLVLNPDKVKHLIDISGKQKKQILGARNRRTLTRILRGDSTTQATAFALAQDLGVTVNDLQLPISNADLLQREPDQWLYEDIAAPVCDASHLPASPILGGQDFIVGRSPIGFLSPLQELLELNRSRSRKIVLRKENHSYVFEVHFFTYSNIGQEMECRLTTGCRFFPIARNEDTFNKTALTAEVERYVWNMLQRFALKHADVLQMADQQYPDHPGKYLPLVRFYQGSGNQRILTGARFYTEFHSDLRSSLIRSLCELSPSRIRANATYSGIATYIEPLRPSKPTMGWRDNGQLIAVDLVWKCADGKLYFAPWRDEDRNAIAEAIQTQDWVNVYSPNLPSYTINCADDAAPDLEADLSIPESQMELVREVPEV